MTTGRIAFVGDVHLDRDLDQVHAFTAFLEQLGGHCSAVVLMGDLFDLWIGDDACQREHHRLVTAALQRLRDRGLEVHYVEGNRDYRIGRVAGEPFDAVHEEAAVFRRAGRTLTAVHGDLANRRDRRYRMWRAGSRSALFWGLFRLLPASRRARVAEGLERRMRSTNRAYKAHVSEGVIREYAESFVDDASDGVVMGHFHVERRLPLDRAEVFVLPEWKAGRRHLEWDGTGAPEYVDSGGI